MLSKPGRLAFGKLPGANLNQFDRLLERPSPRQMLDDLPVAKRLRGRSVLVQTSRYHLLCLYHQSFVKHGIHSEVDTVLEIGGSTCQKKAAIAARACLRPVGAHRRKWLTRQANYFHCPNDSPPIRLVNRCERCRVARAQFLEQ